MLLSFGFGHGSVCNVLPIHHANYTIPQPFGDSTSSNRMPECVFRWRKRQHNNNKYKRNRQTIHAYTHTFTRTHSHWHSNNNKSTEIMSFLYEEMVFIYLRFTIRIPQHWHSHTHTYTYTHTYTCSRNPKHKQWITTHSQNANSNKHRLFKIWFQQWFYVNYLLKSFRNCFQAISFV